MSDFNTKVIDEFRSNAGHVTTAGFGKRLILLHSRGAKSGQTRVHPLLAIPDDGGWLVIGSFAGSPKTPAWVYNLRANPSSVGVEVPSETGIDRFDVHATEIDDGEWDAAWGRFVTHSEQFLKYTETAQGRRFPIFRLTRTS